MQVLKEACGLVEKLPGEIIECKFQVYRRLAEALNKQAFGCPEAEEYAKKALGLGNKIHGKERDKKSMQTIIEQQLKKKKSSHI